MYFGLPEPLYTIGEHDEAGSGCACFLLVPPEPTVASTSVPVTATRNATRRRFVTPTSSLGSLCCVEHGKYLDGGPFFKWQSSTTECPNAPPRPRSPPARLRLRRRRARR